MSVPLYSGNVSQTLYKLESSTHPNPSESIGLSRSIQFTPIEEKSGLDMKLFETYMKQANMSTYYQNNPGKPA